MYSYVELLESLTMSFMSDLYLDPSQEYTVATFSPDLPIGKTLWGGGFFPLP